MLFSLVYAAPNCAFILGLTIFLMIKRNYCCILFYDNKSNKKYLPIQSSTENNFFLSNIITFSLKIKCYREFLIEIITWCNDKRLGPTKAMVRDQVPEQPLCIEKMVPQLRNDLFNIIS